ncbi:MAG: hypothetical protein ACRCRP_00525 [Metamycoplasmataceae bacterium]
MNKKLLISLGSLSTIAVVAPILATVSCASDAPVKVVDLVITAKENPTITAADVKTLETAGAITTEKWNVLDKLFAGAGFISGNKEKFDASINTTDAIVTLTAKTGYTLNGKGTFASAKYTVAPEITEVNLDIKVKASPATELTGIQVFNLTSTNTNPKISDLSQLFDGIDTNNIDKFTVLVNLDDLTKSTVTLTPVEGYLIGGAKTLVSPAFNVKTSYLNITKTTTKPLNITQVDEDALAATTPDAAAQLTALNKLFTGVTTGNQNKFTITVDKTAKTVTLTMLPGFAFGTTGTATTLVSDVYTIVS